MAQVAYFPFWFIRLVHLILQITHVSQYTKCSVRPTKATHFKDTPVLRLRHRLGLTQTSDFGFMTSCILCRDSEMVSRVLLKTMCSKPIQTVTFALHWLTYAEEANVPEQLTSCVVVVDSEALWWPLVPVG